MNDTDRRINEVCSMCDRMWRRYDGLQCNIIPHTSEGYDHVVDWLISPYGRLCPEFKSAVQEKR